MKYADVALIDLVFPLTLLIWSAVGVLLALTLREARALRRDACGSVMLSSGETPQRRLLPKFGGVVALLTPASREISWQLPDADVSMARSEREVTELEPARPAAPAGGVDLKEFSRRFTYWTMGDRDLGQGSLKTFDALVAKFSDRRLRRLVLADFDGARSGDTLHAVLTGEVELSLVVCREMAHNVDLIPHARLRPPYARAAVAGVILDFERNYDEIVVLDVAARRATWAGVLALVDRGLGEPLIAQPKLLVTPETSI